MRTIRVMPDVAGITSLFDYLVPGSMSVQVGSIVRADLHGRRIRGWVIEVDVQPPDGIELREITKVTGLGPTADIIELAHWAARRWLGHPSFYLGTASPDRAVQSLPIRAKTFGDPQVRERETGDIPTSRSHKMGRSPDAPLRERDSGRFVVLGPADDYTDVVAEEIVDGATLIIVPSRRAAVRLATSLRKRGFDIALHPQDWARARAGGTSVIGTRAAAWAPLPGLAKCIVIDAHDEAHQSEASPTWNAIDVLDERARRNAAELVLVGSVARVASTVDREIEVRDQAGGWAALNIVDQRRSDPRSGRYSKPLVDLLRSDKRVVCVLNRKGRAQLLVCAACDEVATCQRCSGPLHQHPGTQDNALACRKCAYEQPTVCVTCGSTRFKQLRAGVTKVREELETLALREVGEVTGESDSLPDTGVLIGTEAVLHRVGKADAVVFLEFDQELLATRYRAAEDALVLLARASRIVGGRRRGGIVIVQTRKPDDIVIEAAVRADPMRLHAIESGRREEFGWPPFGALARVSGPGAPDYMERLGRGVVAFGPDENGKWLIQGSDIEMLTAALGAVERPKQRLRIEVDPPRV